LDFEVIESFCMSMNGGRGTSLQGSQETTFFASLRAGKEGIHTFILSRLPQDLFQGNIVRFNSISVLLKITSVGTTAHHAPGAHFIHTP
jgi:hypothetical protein